MRAVNRSSHLPFRPGTQGHFRRFADMEYEIQDQGEDVLFDDSTNPSLKHDDEEAPLRRRHPEPADKRRLQKAELIPEEEDEHQLS